MAHTEKKVQTKDSLKNKVFSTDPFVGTYDNVLSDEECQHFINISKNSLKRSLVSTAKKGVVSSGRTGLNTWIPHNHDEITKKVGERIAKIVNMPLENAEAYQVIYYGVSQEYRQHYDSWDHNGSEKTLRCMKFGGARIKTALCYLNNVKKGGGTRLNRLNVTIPAEKGKLLVFHNTLSETNHVRHPLSEHAGLPVEEGEKFAFNLWFKECNSKTLYSSFNPGYYSKIQDKSDVINISSKKSDEEEDDGSGNGEDDGSGNGEDDGSGNDKLTTILSSKQHKTLVKDKDIFLLKSFVDSETCEQLVSKCKFNDRTRRDGWINLKTVSELTKKIESATNIPSQYYENINVVEYKAGVVHNKHFTAYDLQSDKGKQYTKLFGQRLLTISVFLSDKVGLSFPTLKSGTLFNKGDVLFYRNVSQKTNERDLDMERIILNKGSENGYVANIYVREKGLKGDFLLGKNYFKNLKSSSNKDDNVVTVENVELLVKEAKAKAQTQAQAQAQAQAKAAADEAQAKATSKVESNQETENYMETFSEVMQKFRKKQVLKSWQGHKSFKYNFKGNFTKFKEYISEYNKIRSESENSSCLMSEHMNKDYELDEKLPLLIVENVINARLLDLLQRYYKETISENVWPLGDRQSNRYKSHNEPMSRFLQYEILPLIEKVVGRKMRPTYTYLSAYVKDADLPPHTDREDCEYTVSFVVDKPKGSNWNIYVHKIQQPIKHKGRYPEAPPLEECEAVDCGSGGLMMFQGTDHIHFREKLDFDYYNILLLHYRSV